MDKSVVEAHPQLYHYTTAAGLQGIVESQQLRATSIEYLNDAEEHTGFFDRRLPRLLEKPVRVAAGKIASTSSGRSQLNTSGGLEEAVKEEIVVLVDALRSTTFKLNKPYVTAFCSVPKQSPDDGLLSQWRGYGPDGGYAIVFETDGLKQLLDEEKKSFYYQFSVWGDVEYYDQDTSQKAAYPETLEREEIVQQTIRSYMLTEKREELDALVEPLRYLACISTGVLERRPKCEL